MPITGHMAGIAIDARIAANIAKLPELLQPKSDEPAEKRAVRILD
jgi:hypothetical protein